MKRRLGAALAAALCACNHSNGLTATRAALHFEPAALSLTAYLGGTAVAAVMASNTGTAGDTLAVGLTGDAAFALVGDSQVQVGAGATVPLTIRFTPTATGHFTARLQLLDSAGSLDVSVDGAGLPDLACTATGPCDAAVFDADAGVCRHSTSPNGAACASPSLCLQDTKCLEGACVGDPKSCDDQNACTQDYCVESDGCHHDDDSRRCVGTELCHAYACDPTSGCTDETAPNGTPCALGDSCQTAEVCLFGSCTGVPVPEGSPCSLWWEPCVTDSACRGGQCHSPTAEAEVPGQLRWDAGLGTSVFGPFTVDGTGTSTFVTFDAIGTPVLAAVDACGKTLWTNAADGLAGALLDGDQLVGWAGPAHPRLIGLAPGSGTRLWSLDLDTATAPSLADAGVTAPLLYETQSPAMSNQGLIYLSLTVWSTPDGGQVSGPGATFIAGVDRAGHLEWLTPLPITQVGQAVTDRAGTAYVAGWQGDFYAEKAVWTLSPSGAAAPAFESQDPVTWQMGAFSGLAVGPDFVFVEGAGAALQPDGGLRYQLPPLGAGPCTVGAAIDAAGDVFATNALDAGPWFGATALGPAGNVLWTTNAGLTNPVLTQEGVVFSTSDDLLCLDDGIGLGLSINSFAPDGGLLWSTSPDQYFTASARLALTPTASLVTGSYDQAIALFAGRVHIAADAPWSRSLGGDNRNRSCPPAR